MVDIYVEALKRLGIAVQVSAIDPAQYRERTNRYDFDMTTYAVGISLSPGNEQRLYWGRDGVEEPGTRNWAGIDSPAVEALIDRLLAAEEAGEVEAILRALDRVLTAGRYVIPGWFAPVSRIAHASTLRFPERLPLYGDWIGFQPDVWWFEE